MKEYSIRNIPAWILGGVLSLLPILPTPSSAMNFDPPQFYRLSQQRVFFSVTRWEKPSFYYVNQGLPFEFFDGVGKVTELPMVYSLRGVEYGFRVGGWPLERFFLQATLPYESVYLEQVPSGSGFSTGLPNELRKTGDFELSAAFFLLGTRKTSFHLGVNGWVRFPTGTNPFDLAFPLMSSGKGASQRSGGLVAGQQAGRFSFFQGLNYEKAGSIALQRFYTLDHPASFQWPDVFHAAARLEFRFFRRSYRTVAAFYDLRMRQVGVLKYGETVLNGKDRLYTSSGGLQVQVDPELAVTGQYSFFPFEFDSNKGRPDFGGLLTLSVTYTPF